MKLNLIWKENTTKYSSGQLLYINDIKIGGYNYNGMRPREDTKRIYIGHCDLPNIIATYYDNNIDEIKSKIEAEVIKWFTKALKEPNKYHSKE